MSNKVNITTLLDGVKYTILHIYIKSDGASGDITKYKIVDPKDFNMGNAKKFCIESVSYALSGFSADIVFDEGINGIESVVMSEGQPFYSDFCMYGGLRDWSGMDGDGCIYLNTYGIQHESDRGMIILKLRRSL